MVLPNDRTFNYLFCVLICVSWYTIGTQKLPVYWLLSKFAHLSQSNKFLHICVIYLFLFCSSVFMTNLLLSICLDRSIICFWMAREATEFYTFALSNYICSVPSYLYNVSCLWVISEIFMANRKTFWVISKSLEISRPIKLCCDWFTANNRTKRRFSQSFRQWITTNWSNKTDKGGGVGREWCHKTKIAI